ncbi:uncharacterized protein B0H18DRAFT_600894 [Fomitopsis serialis]|uniref:uncharacterized protein n=1 Tax=Fomitopsis serialis TaxID=139415 RepID=UPI00200826EF|nr:uncharacterized protein B0H18DRAFT_600894 [Neoantrodia serialis]KAH9933762.1 hypothetical protein B0H18DRAFT_600894 [Neoantrodia serialis]
MRVAKDQRRPFVFAPLALTDDDASPAIDAETLGTINVEFAHAIRIGTRPFKNQPIGFVNQTVHERSKKMGAHCVSLDEARPCPATITHSSTLVDEDVPFYARFIFRYHSRDFLQAEGIMPLDERPANNDQAQATAGRKRVYSSRPDVTEAGPSRKRAKSAMLAVPLTLQADTKPSAAQLAEDEDVVALQHELDAVQQRAQVLQSRIQTVRGSGSSQRVKTERQDAEEDVIHLTHGAIKREYSLIRLATHGGVIDLTLDDD